MVQARVDQNNTDFVLAGARTLDGFTVKQFAAAALTRGDVMGRISADGKLVPIVTAALTAVDGSQYPQYILAEDVDATGGDIANVSVYHVGEFADFGVTFADAETLASLVVLATGGFSITVKEALRMAGILVVASDDDITGFENT